MGIVLVDDVENVAPLEGDAQLVAGDVEVVIRHVGEVGSVVVHRLALLLLRLLQRIDSLRIKTLWLSKESKI